MFSKGSSTQYARCIDNRIIKACQQTITNSLTIFYTCNWTDEISKSFVNIKWISFFELFNETLSRKWKIDWLSRHERFSSNLIWNTYIHMNMNCENSNATLIYESRFFEIITCVRMYQHFQGFCFWLLNTHTYTWNEHLKNSNQCDQSGPERKKNSTSFSCRNS